MTMRAIRKWSIGFGMVNFPVALYSATDSKDEVSKDIHQIHGVCGTRIKQEKKCPKCNIVLQMADIVKGYALDKEHNLAITKEELEALPLVSSRSIQIETFIKDFADPRWVSDTYYLSTDDVGAKPFVLFAKAMTELGVVGLSKIAIKDREHLCIVKPYGGILLLQTIHWASEIREYGEIIPFSDISEKELAMAKTLIQAMTGEADLKSYKDNYAEALKAIIKAKLAGESIQAPVQVEQKATEDLMAQLMASINAVKATPV